MANVETKGQVQEDVRAVSALSSSNIFHFPFSICHGTRRGFSFAEVMFAVVILGIGFIMVAAIFPVAIQQTQATSDDSAGASVARGAANAIAALPVTVLNAGTNVGAVAGTPTTFPLLPPTVKNYTDTDTVPPSVVVPFVGARWDAIKASLTLPSNPRLAYLPFYKRDNSSSVAQLIVVAVACQNQSIYGSADISPVYTIPTSMTTAASGYSAGSITPATVTISGGPAWLGEGCFINVPSYPANALGGRTYLLGRQIQAAGSTEFELVPSDGLSEATGGAAAGVDDGLWNTQDDRVDAPGNVSMVAAGATINYPATLQPTVAYAKLSFPTDSINGRITLSNTLATALGAAAMPATYAAAVSAAPGAFIVVSDDAPYAVGGTGAVNYTQPTTAVSAMYPAVGGVVPRLNGRIFRLGAAITPDNNNPPGTYELDPAYGITDSTVRNLTAMTVVSDNTDTDASTGQKYSSDIWARVYIAGGRTLSVTSNPIQPYTGPAQAIAAYTTFVPVK